MLYGILIVLALILAGAYGGFCYAFLRGRDIGAHDLPDLPQYHRFASTIEAHIAALEAVPFEAVTVTSHDGISLSGAYYAADPNAPTALFFHGYRSSAPRDACGGFDLFRALGYNVLLVDQRAHGNSGGQVITMGVKERQDVLVWSRYIAGRTPESPQLLMGLSMGASTVMMASDLPLPQQVRGIIADCGYESPRSILSDSAARMHLPAAIAYPLVRLGARLFGGFDPEEASALTSVAATALPLLLIHGEADAMVPCAMSHALQAACASPCTLLTVPDAIHAMSYFVDYDAYRQAVTSFCDACLGQQSD